MNFNHQNLYIPQSPQLPLVLNDLPDFNFDPDLFMNELASVTEGDSSSTPTPTDTNLLEVITTNRGKSMIIHQGNLYQQRSQYKDGRISYRCSLYHQRTGSCTALLTTDSQNSLVFSQSTHNHPERSPNTLDSKRRTHRLKEMYTGNPTKPVRVAAEELGVIVNQSMRMRCHRIRKRTESDQQ